jgi:DNA-binding NarL/FixJ family response regulator
MSIRIAIVEDETMVADMLKAWFRRRHDLEVVGIAADGVAGLALCRKQQPDVVTVDIQLPKMDGLTMSRQILREYPAQKILLLTCRAERYCLLQAEEMGVHGYVDKMSPLAVLEKAVRSVAQGERFFSETVRRELNHQKSRPDSFSKILTQRELDVLGLLARGVSDNDIVAHLWLRGHG